MRKKLWKLYLALYILGSVVGVFMLPQPAAVTEILIFIFGTVIYALALYSYIYKKQFLPRILWSIIFWINAFWIFTDVIILFNFDYFVTELRKQGIEDIPTKPNPLDYIIETIFTLPILYAIYKLGQKEKARDRVKSKMRLWKGYFWVVLVLTILTIILAVVENAKLTWYDSLSLVESIAILLGVYAYSFKKKLFSSLFWKIVFLIVIIDTVLYSSYMAFPQLQANQVLSFIFGSWLFSQLSLGEFLLGVIFSAPGFYALYQLGYKKRVESED